MLASSKKSRLAAFAVIFISAFGVCALAQSGGSSTSVTGTVKDPTGAVVTNATVEIRNPVSAFERSASTDSAGRFTIPNVPFNPYHLMVTGEGFDAYVQDIDVRSVVPISLNISLKVKGSSESVLRSTRMWTEGCSTSFRSRVSHHL
jgi:Carboxypeptidase regulatory-like domain